jgi:hypothetical protein
MFYYTYNMKILYLHGYKARPNHQRIGYLEELGHEVVAPYIKYDNEPNIMLELLEDDYDMVIGSSLGAYMGFYISGYKSIPCVAFNPPLAKELMINIKTPTDWDYDGVTPKTMDIILGLKDTVVNPHDTLEWLTFESTLPKVNIHMYAEMTHSIEMSEFTEVMDMVLSRITD